MNKTILAVIIITLVIIGGVFIATQASNNDSEPAPATSMDSGDEIDRAEVIKQESQQAAADVKAPDQNEQAQNPSEKSVELNIFTQDDLIVVQTQLINVLSGTCQLSATHNNDTIEKEAEVIYSPGVSSCAGFSIPMSEFPNSGMWSFSVDVVNNDETISGSAEYNL